MKINGLAIENTFAEAFNMKASRIIVTADNTKWARNAAVSFTCLLYTSPSPRDKRQSRMPSSA